MHGKYVAAVTVLAVVVALALGGVVAVAESTESYGNNLSEPAVFAEGHGVTGYPMALDNGLRGDPETPSFAVPFEYGGETYYLQRTENTWQAATESGPATGQVEVTVDWSDNLRARAWKTDSVIRIEHVLSTVASTEATGYEMAYLYGEGVDEVWGTNTTIRRTTDRCVYSICARLRIERIVERGGEPTGTPIYDRAVHQSFGVDGPSDGYSAEINVAGKLIYGSMWHLDRLDMEAIGLPADFPKEGWYRITFMLDSDATYEIPGEGGDGYSLSEEPCNVKLVALDPSDLPVAEGGEQPSMGPLLQLAEDGTWTSIDIEVVKSPSGGGGGGKGPGASRLSQR